MKKLVLLALMAVIINVGHAQLQVNSTGNVGIGSSPLSDYKLNITSGNIKWQNTSYYPFYFKPNSQDPAFYSENNYGYLGLSNKQLFRIYANGIYMNGNLVLTSDIKIKENIRNRV